MGAGGFQSCEKVEEDQYFITPSSVNPSISQSPLQAENLHSPLFPQPIFRLRV